MEQVPLEKLSNRRRVDRDPSVALRNAHAALDDGQTERAREFAQDVLNCANESGDKLMEAHAFACLAHCDRLMSRLRRASDGSRRAAHIYGALGDLGGEAAALTTLAHVSTFLGRNDEAIEAALLSVSLGEQLPHGLQTALALNYLGVAYGWSGNFADAHATLDRAAQAAANCTPPASPLQPRTNQAWLEAVRLAQERAKPHPPADLQRLLDTMALVRTLEQAGGARGLVQGSHVTAKAITALLDSLVHCWLSEVGEARTAHLRGNEWLSKYPGPTWLNGMAAWVAGEISCVEGNYSEAERQFHAVVELASGVEHEQLACLGHLLTSQLLTHQGRHAQAVLELRKLRQREQLVRTESLKSRGRAVQWELTARHSQQELLKFQASSRQFERWSLEDALTGIANRRCFEGALSECLRNATGSAQPVSVALIDVDRFKSINDGFTHQVGDRVLKTVAAILTAQVREQDLAARLAGDEFVVMFVRSEVDAAAQVCRRIRDAVLEFPWQSIAPGLQVSVSVGSAQFTQDDTVESLLHRSDVAMYSEKRLLDRASSVC